MQEDRHAPRVAPAHEKAELAEAEPPVARLATLVDPPGLDDVDPGADEVLVPAGDKVEEGAAHARRSREQAVVRAVQDAAVDAEAVEDERGANGLLWERVKGDRFFAVASSEVWAWCA